MLTEKIYGIHDRSLGIYSRPRIHTTLQAGSICVAKKSVAPLVKATGLKARKPPQVAFNDD